ncbi:hypothetical protein EMPG_16208 [Blastomyces silverae]|uniref:Uncharacterized protein n=1 Tax=Blastomyces silverae TaxID=2060906 RepID=A0A0H1BBI0_9EURO|nr:hypothetical protein EMPG_16208 [Blastomyces silverae]
MRTRFSDILRRRKETGAKGQEDIGNKHWVKEDVGQEAVLAKPGMFCDELEQERGRALNDEAESVREEREDEKKTKKNKKDTTTATAKLFGSCVFDSALVLLVVSARAQAGPSADIRRLSPVT